MVRDEITPTRELSASQQDLENYSLMFGRQIRIFPDGNNLDEYLDSRGMQRVEVDILPPGQVLAVSQRFRVHSPPVYHEKGGVRTSDAQYYIDEHETSDGHVIYLSKLDPNAVTSSHRHPEPVREFYFLLYGHAFQSGRPMDRKSFINHGEHHQVTTTHTPALLGILMENAAQIPSHLRHIV